MKKVLILALCAFPLTAAADGLTLDCTQAVPKTDRYVCGVRGKTPGTGYTYRWNLAGALWVNPENTAPSIDFRCETGSKALVSVIVDEYYDEKRKLSLPHLVASTFACEGDRT